MSYNSKYKGQEIEAMLDRISNGEIGGGGSIPVETDPIFLESPAASITEEKKEEWDNKVDFVNPELKMAEVNGFQDDSGTTYALPNSSVNNTNEANLTIAIADANFVIGEGMVDGDDNRFALPTNNAGLADSQVLATKQDVANNKNLIYKANSATSGTLNLEANVCHHFPNPLNGTFTIQQPTNYSNNNAALVESRIVFTTGTTVPSIVFRFTAATRWANGVAPTFEANTTYEISLFFPADVNTKGPLGVCVGFKQA